jgi:hypothetical protein
MISFIVVTLVQLRVCATFLASQRQFRPEKAGAILAAPAARSLLVDLVGAAL